MNTASAQIVYRFRCTRLLDRSHPALSSLGGLPLYFFAQLCDLVGQLCNLLAELS